ncbi:MAG: hypothetical protein ACYTAF_00140 [Planctomycetota bacterium]|jgi:hypothetical protein
MNRAPPPKVLWCMVGLQAPTKKQFSPSPGRALRAATPYFSRSTERRKEFVLGERPGLLKGVSSSVHKKIWRQYQNHLKRTPPLDRAEFYAREMKERRMRSFRALSLLLGEPVNKVGQHIKLLDLPEPVKAFLREHREPKYLRYFSERRLRELTALRSARALWRRFREMVREADRKDGIWT